MQLRMLRIVGATTVAGLIVLGAAAATPPDNETFIPHAFGTAADGVRAKAVTGPWKMRIDTNGGTDTLTAEVVHPPGSFERLAQARRPRHRHRHLRDSDLLLRRRPRVFADAPARGRDGDRAGRRARSRALRRQRSNGTGEALRDDVRPGRHLPTHRGAEPGQLPLLRR
jgi:hypothetical protein